jgi:hypothetical protein
MRVTLHRGLAVSIVVASIAACTDFSAPEEVVLPDVLVANPSFATDIQPIFTARCATASCHNLASQQMGLNLQDGYAYAEIVEVESPTSRGLKYIRAGEPDNSYLVHMIEADPTPRFARPRMPLGRTPLTDNQIQTIINWVSAGAPQN